MIRLTSNRKWTKEEIFGAARRLRANCWMMGESDLGEWIMNAWTDEMIVDYAEGSRLEMDAYNLKWHIEEAAKIIKEYA